MINDLSNLHSAKQLRESSQVHAGGGERGARRGGGGACRGWAGVSPGSRVSRVGDTGDGLGCPLGSGVAQGGDTVMGRC